MSQSPQRDSDETLAKKAQDDDYVERRLKAILETENAEHASRPYSVSQSSMQPDSETESARFSEYEQDPEFERHEEGGDFLKDPRVVKLLLEEFKKREKVTQKETLHAVEQNLVVTLFKAKKAHRSVQRHRVSEELERFSLNQN